MSTSIALQQQFKAIRLFLERPSPLDSCLVKLHLLISPTIKHIYNKIGAWNTQQINDEHGYSIVDTMKLFPNAILGDTENKLGSLLFYTFFTASAHIAHLLMKQNVISDPIAYIAPYIVGAILQGRPDCPAQETLDNNQKKHYIAARVGGFNGLMCCLLVGSSLALIGTNNILAQEVSVVAVALITAPIMCGLERLAAQSGCCKQAK